jgi:hypothetical protein
MTHVLICDILANLCKRKMGGEGGVGCSVLPPAAPGPVVLLRLLSASPWSA